MNYYMATIANILFRPLISVHRKFRGRRQAFVDDCPPPTLEDTELGYGSYCIKATVKTTDWDGIEDATFIGHSQDMSIVSKTEIACERHKRSGTKCSNVEMVIKGGECEEHLFMKTKDGNLVRIPIY